MTLPPIIHWFRRDLRLHDNTALNAALASGAPVVPLFTIDDALLRSERMSAARLQFMLDGLTALDQSLRQRGSRLLIRRGDPVVQLAEVAAELGAVAVYFNRDYSPFAHQRDGRLAGSLGMPVHAYDDLLVHAPGEVLKGDGEPFIVFTPFMRQWSALPKPLTEDPPAEGHFHPLTSIDSLPLPTLEQLGFSSSVMLPRAGEAEALKRLDGFAAAAIYDYRERRNLLVADPYAGDPPPGTSYLSPYLHLGMLSPRAAYQAAVSAQEAAPTEARGQSAQTWINELAWREFYTHILYHFPHVADSSFRPEFDRVPFRSDRAGLEAWKAGMTGYPVVDAAMRQLAHTGWMHNRARMIVASFLSKDLLIYWREGDLHFMQHLIDGDLAANNGGWQWAAGTGTDAQPYFRIFNPVLQSKKFDPDGAYIRRWVPDLRDVPDRYLHAPWEMPIPPRAYPAPIVDHGAAREAALSAYSTIRQYS